MLTLFKRTKQNAAIAQAVYGAIVAQARQPALYAEYGVPDTLEGRFDMVLLHLVVTMERLRRAGDAGIALAQAAFDLFLTDMDRTLRESGVGDLAVPRKMKVIAESFYGRWEAYAKPLDDGDNAALAAAIARNVFADDTADAAHLAAYALAVRRGLDGEDDKSLLVGSVKFPGALPAQAVAR